MPKQRTSFPVNIRFINTLKKYFPKKSKIVFAVLFDPVILYHSVIFVDFFIRTYTFLYTYFRRLLIQLFETVYLKTNKMNL